MKAIEDRNISANPTMTRLKIDDAVNFSVSTIRLAYILIDAMIVTK